MNERDPLERAIELVFIVPSRITAWLIRQTMDFDKREAQINQAIEDFYGDVYGIEGIEE